MVGKPVVLVVDDNEATQFLIERLLVAKNIEVLKAACYKQARDILASGRKMDLALLDLSIPPGGLKHFEEVRKMASSANVPIMIADSTPLVAESANNLGTQLFADKSSGIRSVVEAIHVFIAQAG